MMPVHWYPPMEYRLGGVEGGDEVSSYQACYCVKKSSTIAMALTLW